MHATNSTRARRSSLALLCLLTIGALLMPAHPAFAADAPAPKSKGTNSNNSGKATPTQSWSGTWNNRRYNTSGPLTCTIVGEQGGQWMARFTGTGVGRQFNYIALITVRRNGNVMSLQGSTRVDGDNYQWTGTISGTTMTGSFRSNNGNNGEFRLQAKR
ncbi:MAG: hypothetical protein AB1705_17010 [Verrucomicrobiota bacterium]